MKSKKTTDADFMVFKDEVNRLIRKFRIDDWRIYYTLERLKGNNAECVTNAVSKTATFHLNTSIYVYTDDEIKALAMHEVCHLLIADISDLASCRWVIFDEVNRADESVANKLKVIFMELGV